MSILDKYTEKHKKKLIAGAAGIATIGVVSLVWLGIRDNAYVVSVEGKPIGIIRTKEEAQRAYDEVVAGIDEQVGVPFVVNETLQVEGVHASKKELSSYEALQAAINEAVSYDVEGYEIVVDGTRYAVVRSKEEATKVLEQVATAFAPHNGTVTLAVAEEQAATTEEKQDEVEGTPEEITKQPLEENILATNDASRDHQEDISKVTISGVEAGEQKEEEVTAEDEKAQDIKRTIESYDFNEEVVIKSCFVEAEKILSLEEAEERLKADRYEKEAYELVEGDNIWDIAVAFDTTQERILALNPDIQEDTVLQIGQVINVERGLPILSITTVEKAIFKELIPGEIQYKPSETFYEGVTKVIVEGNDGVKELTVEVTKVNGEEVSRQTLAEKVLSEAKVTVIAYGVKKKETQEAPDTGSSNGSNSSSNSGGSSNTGTSNTSRRYIHPLKGAGRISSTYGPRWGTFHYGLDFAAPAGTPIYASRAGKVIYSAYNQGGYGKLIIIEHADGTQSYYAHCSSLYVNVGQSVSQGQRIAGVGTTGNSTGNHLHFEIRVNGKPVDPAHYL